MDVDCEMAATDTVAQDVADDELMNLISCEDLTICTRVLAKLVDHKVDIKHKRFRELRQAIARITDDAAFLPNKAHMTTIEKKSNEKLRKRQRIQQQRAADEQWIMKTSLRQSRSQALQSLEAPHLCILDGPCVTRTDVPPTSTNATLEQLRHCFICHKKFVSLHHFYDQLCQVCATFQWTKRHLTVSLEGRTALVTGGRVKIGFHTVLKLLAARCNVVVTTRFPHDCAERFRAQPGFDVWGRLLHIYGLDLRHMEALEQFCEHVNEQYTGLDILVNNACQTVRRPRAYYEPLVKREAAILDQETSNLGVVKSYQGQCRSAEASQLQLCTEDRTMSVGGETLPGQTDVNGQLVDLRRKHSWVMRLHEIETPELAEVFCINALAPFVLNAKLKPLMMKSVFKNRFIVNVSAMEGKFYRYKSQNHPHTNMAKAALNMMTRTSAQDYAADRIYMNSVDTGWINDENPLPKAQAHAKSTNFQTPIDEIDAAARILNPIFDNINDDLPPHGKFFKDYAPTEW